MPASDTSGVVLRTSDWSETSLIVTWFTRDFGKLRTVAKGAYRPKSPFRGKLDLFYLNDIVFVPSRGGDLHTLSECYVENPFPHIRERLDAFTAASYCCELVDLATEPEGPVPPLFKLLTESLAALDVAKPTPLFMARFELLALDALGFRPDVELLDLDPGTRRIMSDLLDDSPGLARLRLTAAQHRQIDSFVTMFIGQQFGRLPKSRRFLHTAARKEG
ncbi:MAG: DNA repair protein RecO [Verrucomicrobia bacterium]|nr:DNA repair protein RecO [Verrucomicrobiota bacterium]